MSRYEGLYTFDTDSHMYVPVGQVDDDYFNVREEDPKQPLIEDQKARKAVRAWAEANMLDSVIYDKDEDYITYVGICISFDNVEVFEALEHNSSYTIDELCGEEEK